MPDTTISIILLRCKIIKIVISGTCGGPVPDTTILLRRKIVKIVISGTYGGLNFNFRSVTLCRELKGYAMTDRPRVIIGNWKMYKTHPEAESYFSELIPLVKNATAHICLAVPFTLIEMAARLCSGTNITIGAQTMNDASEGAFTGEIAARMLVESGARFVILGHSERRRFFAETDSLINLKVKKSLQNKLQPVVCVGETLAERQSEKTEEVLHRQLEGCLADLDTEQLREVWIAYEPIWAIGTGETATPACAEETHQLIGRFIETKWGAESASQIVLLYGGSVKPDKASALLERAHIDGLLVGGASLSPELFATIVNASHTSQVGNQS